MTSTTRFPLNEILVGDVRERLKELPDASVDCIITSPPYWNLRNYGHDKQIGAEATVDAWADQIAAVASEYGRVLTPTGSLWLNLGDSYARTPSEGASRKSLLMGPEPSGPSPGVVWLDAAKHRGVGQEEPDSVVGNRSTHHDPRVSVLPYAVAALLLRSGRDTRTVSHAEASQPVEQINLPATRRCSNAWWWSLATG
jgi:DNA methylase